MLLPDFLAVFLLYSHHLWPSDNRAMDWDTPECSFHYDMALYCSNIAVSEILSTIISVIKLELKKTCNTHSWAGGVWCTPDAGDGTALPQRGSWDMSAADGYRCHADRGVLFIVGGEREKDGAGAGASAQSWITAVRNTRRTQSHFRENTRGSFQARPRLKWYTPSQGRREQRRAERRGEERRRREERRGEERRSGVDAPSLPRLVYEGSVAG